MTNEDKMSKFTEAVLTDARQEKQQLMKQLEDEKASRLSQAEDEILKEAYDYIQKEIAAIKIKIGKEMSVKNLEIRKEILNHRNMLTHKVFNKVKERIVSFTKTDEYKNTLSELIKDAVLKLGAEGTVVLYRSEDTELINKLLTETGTKLEVQTDNTIKLGGLRFSNENKGILMDETFDSKYNEQLSKFEETSGLIIK